jgi:hypothetical protein
MGAVKPAETFPGYQLASADNTQATLNVVEDVVDEGQQLKDMQLAVLNLLEDSTIDRLEAEAATRRA